MDLIYCCLVSCQSPRSTAVVSSASTAGRAREHVPPWTRVHVSRMLREGKGLTHRSSWHFPCSRREVSSVDSSALIPTPFPHTIFRCKKTSTWGGVASTRLSDIFWTIDRNLDMFWKISWERRLKTLWVFFLIRRVFHKNKTSAHGSHWLVCSLCMYCPLYSWPQPPEEAPLPGPVYRWGARDVDRPSNLATATAEDVKSGWGVRKSSFSAYALVTPHYLSGEVF